jgi:cellulose synthase/poly-beta-1,6-N-acetylglucosamine synthase-like glycosyltransferase
MRTLLETLIAGAALLLMVPVLVLLVEVFAAVMRRGRDALLAGDRPRVTVLVPAHDEALIISATLRSILSQLAPGDRLVVVADNCSDETAALAAALGAEVLERRDLERRGKGYALDYGIRHLESDPPETVLVVDADCRLSPLAIDRLARLSRVSGRPVQALYLMQAPEGSSLKMHIAEFAWVIKNQVRPLGLHRLGLPCQLMGTGMAFPWACIRSANLATGHIVEDLTLGIELTRRGTPPLFCPEALVTSEFPSSSEGVRSQRTRWEHGHLSVILSDAPQLFFGSLATLKFPALAMALDLAVPPLSLLTLQVLAVWSAAALFFIVERSYVPLAAASVPVALLALAVLVSWRAYARHIVSLANLALAVLHAFFKIPLYLKFLVARQVKWIRSKREADEG